MIKTLAKSLREYKKGSVFTILLSILEAVFEILIPLCMAEVIDKGIDPGRYECRMEIRYRAFDLCCTSTYHRCAFGTYRRKNLGRVFR